MVFRILLCEIKNQKPSPLTVFHASKGVLHFSVSMLFFYIIWWVLYFSRQKCFFLVCEFFSLEKCWIFDISEGFFLEVFFFGLPHVGGGRRFLSCEVQNKKPPPLEHQPNSLKYFPLVFRSPATRGGYFKCPFPIIFYTGNMSGFQDRPVPWEIFQGIRLI